MKTFSHLQQYLPDFFLEWEIFQMKVVEKLKTHILCSVAIFRKSCRLWDNVEKYGRAREAVNDNMAARALHAGLVRLHARKHTPAPMLKHTHTHRPICNTFCSSTATMVLWRLLDVTILVHCLSCVCFSSRLTFKPMDKTVWYYSMNERSALPRHLRALENARTGYFRWQTLTSV